MDRPTTLPPDPLIDQVRETRAQLVREHGGLRGWVTHLQKQQRMRPEKFPCQPKDQPSKIAAEQDEPNTRK